MGGNMKRPATLSGYGPGPADSLAATKLSVGGSILPKLARFVKLTPWRLILALWSGMLCFGTSNAASINDVFAGIAMRVPEFAGVDIDEQQDVLNIHLRRGNAAAAQAVIAELKTAFGDLHLRQSRVQVLSAIFGFLELKRWHDDIAMSVLQHSGVTFTGIDHRNNQVVIGVEDAGVRSSVESELAAFHLPPEAVNFMETGPIQVNSSLSDFRRPLLGGLEIGTSIGTQCSLGFNARRSGISGFVTASHCSSRDGAPPGTIGTTYFQPADGVSRIGVETVDPRFHGCFCTPSLFGLRLCLFNCRSSDSAFVRLDPSIGAAVGLVARPLTSAGPAAWDGTSTFNITGGATPFIGLSVAKIGRTTGRTNGTVLLTGLTVPIVSENFPFVTRKLLQNQVAATNVFEAGDSGAPVIRVTGDPESGLNPLSASLEGLGWAGLGRLISGAPGALFSPISGVQTDIGPLTFAANPNADLMAISPDNFSGFCRVVGDKVRVAVRVANLGASSAPGSTTRVDFGSFGSFDVPTPVVPSGGFVDLGPIEPPPGCFNPDCGFAITVDTTNNVNEGPAGEGNNTVVSDCVG
jgi:hypothetical protein